MNKLITLVLLLIAGASFAQQVRVISKSDLLPVSNCLIYNTSKSTSVTTDNNGSADLSQFKESDELTFSHLSFIKIEFKKSDIEKIGNTVYLSYNAINLHEVVISANKVEETRKTVAQQIQVITAQDIANIQAQSTADLLGNGGNIHVQKSQLGGGSPNIRGFEGNRVLLEIDGVRMNNLIYRGGHMQDLIKTDNNYLERAEILYGPSSTVYGSDALGGVIHLYTKKPLFATGDKLNVKANAMYRYGSVDNESAVHADFNIGGKKLASLTSFTFSNFGDLRGGRNQNPFYTESYGERPNYAERINGKDSVVKNADRYLQVQSAYSQYDLLQKFAFKQGEHITHGLNIQYSNSSDVPRYDRLTLPGAGGNGLKSAEWYYGPQSRLLTSYDFNLKNPEGTFQSIHFGLNYQALEESRHNRNFGDKWLKKRIENVNVVGANLDFQKKIKAHDMRFGADVQLNGLKSTANKKDIGTGEIAKFATRFPDGENKMNNYAIYISDTWKINDQLTLTDGIRAGYSTLHCTLSDPTNPPDPLPANPPFSTIDQKTPVYSGSIGIINSPSDDVKISFLVSTGFRVPNVDDVTKIFDPAPGTIMVPNVDLKPEKTINYELGITKIFNDKTQWENSIFYTNLYDAIVASASAYNGKDSIMYDGALSKVYSNQNKGKAYLYGFSSNFKSQCTDNLLLVAGFDYTYGRIKTDSSDSPLDHIPPIMAHAMLTYTNHKFSSDFSVEYNGWKHLKNYSLDAGAEDNLEYATAEGMPAWFTVNLHLSYKVYKYITIQTGVDNIFDTQYRTFASGINAPGRNVFVTLRGTF